MYLKLNFKILNLLLTNYMVKSGSGWICFINPAKSGSGRISQKQIRYSPTFHPTQVNSPCINPSQTGRCSIYLLRRDGRLSGPRWLVTYWDGLPTHRWSVTHPSSKAATHSRESSSQPVDHKSDTLTTTPPIQHCYLIMDSYFCNPDQIPADTSIRYWWNLHRRLT